MAGPGSQFSGPVISGTKKDADGNGAANVGLAVLTQSVTLTQNSTTAVTESIVVPYGSQLVDFLIDTTTAWNSATSADLTIGSAAAGTQYAGSTAISVATAGRASITFSGTELTAMQSVGANTTVYVTVTPTGATSAGETIVTIRYVQKVELTQG